MACLFCSPDGISAQEIHYPSNLRHSLQRYQWQPLWTPPYFLLRLKNPAITLKTHRYNIHSVGNASVQLVNSLRLRPPSFLF